MLLLKKCVARKHWHSQMQQGGTNKVQLNMNEDSQTCLVYLKHIDNGRNTSYVNNNTKYNS
jgi:hypothetical protein